MPASAPSPFASLIQRILAEHEGRLFSVAAAATVSTANTAHVAASKELDLAKLKAALDLVKPADPLPRLVAVPDRFCVQFRFPRSKRRRIRRKWAKDPRNFRGEDSGLPTDGGLYVRALNTIYLRESLRARLGLSESPPVPPLPISPDLLTPFDTTIPRHRSSLPWTSPRYTITPFGI